MKLWPRNMPVSSAILQRFCDLKAMSVLVSPAIRNTITLAALVYIYMKCCAECGCFVMLHYLQLCSLPAYLQVWSV